MRRLIPLVALALAGCGSAASTHFAVKSRLAGANDAKTYRVHDKLGEPCRRCGTPLARVDFEEHTIYYCPECQTEGRVLKDRRLSRLLR